MQKHIENNCFKIKSQGKCFPCSPFTGDRSAALASLSRGGRMMSLPLATGFLMLQVCDLSGGTEMVKKREKTAPKVTQNSQMLTSACPASLTEDAHRFTPRGDSISSHLLLQQLAKCSIVLHLPKSCRSANRTVYPLGRRHGTNISFFIFPLCSTTIWVFQQHSSPCSLASHFGRNASRAKTQDNADPEPWLTPTW